MSRDRHRSLLALFGQRMQRLSLALQKRYDPRDPTMTFVDREDDLDFLCEGYPSPRALMSCGHAVTPPSLTNWCCQQLEQGETRFSCGQCNCGAEWSYEEVCKMALLTPEEKSYFQKTLALNAAPHDRKCPDCKSSVVRQNESDLCVSCPVCTARKGHVYEFCWQCLREWRGPKPRSDHCQNDGCSNSALETLKTCPDIVIGHVSGCPSIRACPTCGSLLEHTRKGCKNTDCPHCGATFCFVCLKTSRESFITGCSCFIGVAPRQTSIPVRNKK